MIYYGFFDAAFDETAGTYDRTYNSGDFTGYFEKFIGSGVCVYNNPDSFKVSISGTNTIVTSGYLFIRGYWLKNDSDYTISFTGVGDGVYAVYAKLNLGARLIELGQMAKAESYSDTLILAYVTITSGVLSVQYTRYNADICGVIDAVGSLSTKIEYAINYIDTGIESKLQQIEQDLQNQSDIINSKLDEANSLIAKIAPPPIGTVKFSASSTIEDGWLKCDGSFISESQYPELVAALGKLTPSGDKFKLIDYVGEIPSTGVTNFVLFEDYLWTFCLSNKTLYGIPVNSGQLKTINITCDDTRFNNFKPTSFENPLALSIFASKTKEGAKMFLSQIIKDNYIQPINSTYLQYFESLKNVTTTSFLDALLIFGADFISSTSTINVSRPFETIKQSEAQTEESGVYLNYVSNTVSTYSYLTLPYVTSINKDGKEIYYCAIGSYIRLTYSTQTKRASYDGKGICALEWNEENTECDTVNTGKNGDNLAGRAGFSDKNKGEIVVMSYSISTNTIYEDKYYVRSFPNGIFDGYGENDSWNTPSSNIPMNIAGYDITLAAFNLEKINTISKLSDTSKTIPLIDVPNAARIFLDAGIYLFDKDMYFIFVGTGLVFSRTFNSTNDIGYLDTTSVMGVVNQYGDLRYDDQTGVLYIMGQDTTNKIKVVKIVLNTLYDYANDGAWLPLIASDGVPAWIKAKEVE